MKKIIGLGIAVAVIIALVTTGTLAYFSDTETSEDNQFTAGTIDLAVNAQNPWGQQVGWDFIDIKPCQDLDPITLRLENVGNNEGILYTCMKYNELDKYDEPEPDQSVFEFTSKGNAAMELSADQFAAILYVSAVTYQYWCPDEGYSGSLHDDLPNWLAMDINSDGKVSLYEIKQSSPIPYDPTNGPFPATAIIEYIVTFHLADSLTDWDVLSSAIVTGVEDNRPQADGVEFIVSGILLQVGAPTPPTCP